MGGQEPPKLQDIVIAAKTASWVGIRKHRDTVAPKAPLPASRLSGQWPAAAGSRYGAPNGVTGW